MWFDKLTMSGEKASSAHQGERTKADPSDNSKALVGNGNVDPAVVRGYT